MQPLKAKLVSLLRWSEQYTKTDMVYLVRGGSLLSIGTIATALSSFALSIAFANFLSKESYGVYKYVLSLASILAAFTLTGLETAVTQAVSRGNEDVLRRAFWTNLKWSMPMALAAMVIGAYYLIQGNVVLGASLFIIAFAQPLTGSAALAGGFLSGKKYFGLAAGYYSARAIIPAAALFIAMLVTDNPLIIVASYFLANLLVALAAHWYTLVHLVPNRVNDSHALTYGKHLSFMDILLNVADNLDRVLVFQILGAAPLAIYSFAVSLPSQTKLLTKSLAALTLPKFAERPAREVRKGMEEKMLRLLLIGGLIAGAYIVAAPFLFRLIYPRYMDAVFLSQIYAISLIGIAVGPVNIFLIAKRKMRSQYFIKISSAIFQLISAFAGVMIAGLLGLILSRVATRFYGALAALYFYYFDRTEEDEEVHAI